MDKNFKDKSREFPTSSLCVPAKSLQSCPTLCDPMDCSLPSRLLCPWDSPRKNTGVGCCAFLQGNLSDPGTEPATLQSPALAGGFFTTSVTWEAHLFAAAAAAKSLQSRLTLCNPRDGSPPGSPVPGFSRQEHWSGLPFPSPMHESEK